MNAVFTIGHSTRSQVELVALLRENEVRLLVDVRRIPRSRNNPHFDRAALERSLPSRGIGYLHDVRLGGRRSRPRGAVRTAETTNAGWRVDSFHRYADWALGPEFAAGKADLIALARPDQRLAIMCAEAVWWRCHRRIIADWLVAAGASVFHILGPGRVAVATMTPMARVALVQATLPHSDPKSSEFVRRNGHLTLSIMAPRNVGLPNGRCPRRT